MQTLDYKNSKLSYKKSGHGSQVLLAFHGFGQDHRAYDVLAEALKEQYTIYAFDLYFHGRSEWHEGETPLEKKYLKEIIEKFLTENAIQTFSVTGFSLGCRFALAIVEAFTERIEKVFLLAPDGIKTSFWFTLSTYPVLLRKFFKSMIHHPARFKVIVNTLHEVKVMDKGLLKFAEHQMNTEEKRRRVYYSWVVFRHLKFNRNKLIELIRSKNLPVTIVAGIHDRVITPTSMKRFTKKIPHVVFTILDSGHTALLKDTALANVF